MFQKKAPASTHPRSAQRTTTDAMGEASFSVLGAATQIKGDITATADLHIDGRIEGDIHCTGLVQGETSEIHGAITAQTARLAGTLHGSITSGDLVILKSAHIHGDVEYDTLTVEHGAQIDGRLTPRAADGAPRLVVAN